MQRNLIVCAAGCVAVTTTVAVILLGKWAKADEPIVKQLYGRGAHAYFEGDYEAAHDALSQAIKLKSQDPRVYYFRGMTYWKTGREKEAEADFAEGARLEATALDDLFGVNRSLERVQGDGRLAIEDARRDARVAEVARQQAEDAARYNRIKSREPSILEGFPPKVPPEKTPPPKAKPEPKAKEPAPDPKVSSASFNPFAETRLPRVAPAKVAVNPDPPTPKVAANPVPPKPKAAPPNPDPGQPKAVNGKGAGRAVLKVLGGLIEDYVEDLSGAIPSPPPIPAQGIPEKP